MWGWRTTNEGIASSGSRTRTIAGIPDLTAAITWAGAWTRPATRTGSAWLLVNATTANVRPDLGNPSITIFVPSPTGMPCRRRATGIATRGYRATMVLTSYNALFIGGGSGLSGGEDECFVQAFRPRPAFRER